MQPFAQVYHEMSPRVQRGRGVQLLAATMKAYRMTTRAMQQEMQKYDFGGTGQVKRQHSSPRTHPKRHFLTTPSTVRATRSLLQTLNAPCVMPWA